MTEIYKPEDCIEKMMEGMTQGKVKGTTTYNSEIDELWKWRKQEFNIWTGYSNEGKFLSIEEDIPTPEGWKKMKDLKINDKVFDESGKPCNVTFISSIKTDEPCYRIIFTDSTLVDCGESHQWVVNNIASRASKKRQDKRGELKLRGYDQRNKCLTPFITTCKEMVKDFKEGGRSKYSIDLCGSPEYNEISLPIPPYTLGAWLGDGHSSTGVITGVDKEIFDRISEDGFTISNYKKPTVKGILDIIGLLRGINVLNNKHIPQEYLISSTSQRIELLKGLMDTDGTIDSLGRCTFNNCNKRLSDNVHELLCSLGIKVYRSERPAKLYGRVTSTNYELKFKTDFSVFNLERKKKREHLRMKNKWRIIKDIVPIPPIPVMCIQVDSPNHMYLCTKYYIPTHNSLLIKQLCLIKALEENWRFLFSSPEDYPPEEFFDDMIHTLSGRSTDKDRSNYIDPDLYMKCYNLIKDNFIFVYLSPPGNTIKKVLDSFGQVMENTHIDGAIIDPLLKFSRPKEISERDDIYASYIGSLAIDFARHTNVSLHLIMHQLTPKLNEKGVYPKPNMYSVKGGGSWVDGCDNLLYIQRPNYAIDKQDDLVIFGSQKIKKQKLIGLPGEYSMRFDRRTNRYITLEGQDVFNFNKFL